MQILTSIRNVLQSLACGILLPVLFAACGSTGKGPAADSTATATATLPVRSNDEVVAHACRILDTATRQMETATDVATLADLASDAMGEVARYRHTLADEEVARLDAPEGRSAISEIMQALNAAYRRKMESLQHGSE